MRIAPLPLRIAHLPLLIAALVAALLLAGLAPRFGGVRVGEWTQICTASGMAWVKVGDDAPARPDSTQGSSHCPWCAMQPPAALPPAPLALRLAGDLRHVLPLAFWQAPRRLHAWTAAQPRGPPAA